MAKNKNQKKPKTVFDTAAGKQPVAVSVPPQGKHARSLVPIPAQDDFPAWQFRHLDGQGEWCWTKLTSVDIPVVLSRLREYETMTWGEIFNNDATGTHEVPIGQLCRDAQKRLTDLKLDDLDVICSIRITAKARVWGFRRGERVCHLLWWDPDHTVYPVEKKHT